MCYFAVAQFHRNAAARDAMPTLGQLASREGFRAIADVRSNLSSERQTMLFVSAAALVGGVVTACALLPVGILSAVVVAPISGSACGLLAAMALFYRRGSEWQSPNELKEQTDAMVAALRRTATLGHLAEKEDESGGPGEQAA